MRLKAAQWSAHLRGTLARAYGLFADDPLLTQEAEDALLAAARQQGYAQRERLNGGSSAPWERMKDERNAGSLFAERRVLLLRLDSPKPPREGTAALEYWLASPPEDAILVISGARPDANTQKSAWFKALESKGHTLILYAPEGKDWPRWVEARLAQAGLRADAEAVQVLSSLSEGNLLACSQSITRLQQLAGNGQVDAAAVRAVLGDSSQFSIYDLADAALRGEPRHALRILDRLRQGDGEPTLCLWALHRDCRLLLQLQDPQVQAGSLFSKARIFPPRQDWLRNAARRLSTAGLLTALQDCAAIDARIKGQDPTPVWPALADLVLRIAGPGPSGHNKAH
ncbi:DNA polymerase III subunit delta [Acidithiobacillus sp.]